MSSWPVARARSQVCMKTSAVKNREIASGSATDPMCRLLSTRSAEAGSSRSACTSPWRCRHAPAGSSSADGPAGSCTSDTGGEERREPLDEVAHHVARGPLLDRGRVVPLVRAYAGHDVAEPAADLAELLCRRGVMSVMSARPGQSALLIASWRPAGGSVVMNRQTRPCAEQHQQDQQDRLDLDGLSGRTSSPISGTSADDGDQGIEDDRDRPGSGCRRRRNAGCAAEPAEWRAGRSRRSRRS